MPLFLARYKSYEKYEKIF